MIERKKFFKGAQADTKKGKAMSPGTSASGGTRHGGGGGGDGPPSVVHKPKGPTAAEIAAAKAKAEAEKRRLEAEARQKHLKDFKDTQKKKTSWGKKNWEDIKALGTVPYNFAKGVFGNIKKPGEVTQVTLTDAMKEDLINKAKEKSTPTGNIDYTDYNTPTKTFTGLNKFMDSMDIANALTMGGTNFKTDELGNIEFTGGAYDFNKDNVITNFIDQGGMTGLAKKLGAEKIGEKIYDWTGAKGGVARKKYSTGGVLDITGEEEITTEEGNDISLVDETETGVSTLFKEKNNDYAVQGGVKNYLGEQEMVSAPKYWQSAPDHPETELTYITKPEKDLLVKADLHGSLHGSVNKGPEGIISLNGWGDAGDFDGPSSVSSGGGNPNEDRAAEEAHANEFAGIDSGGWDPGVFSPGTTPSGENVNTSPNVTTISDGDIWDWDDTSDIDDVLEQKQDIVNRAIIFMREKYPKSTTYAKNKPGWFTELTSIPTSPWGIALAIGKDMYNTKELKDLMKEMEDAGLVGGPPGTNPQIYDEMWMHLENRKRKKDEEEKDDDGPEVPVVAPVTEEIEDSYAMVGDWMSRIRGDRWKVAYLDKLERQAAELQENRDFQENTMFLNSGGLANLFRVKN